MQVKTQLDELQNYLIDASNLPGGHADKLFIPTSTEEIAEIIREANEKNISVTISGSRTGLVGGCIPFGGYLISLEKFNQIKEIGEDFAVAQAGVILADFQKETEAKGLFYPPDPTEWSCQLGGTVATNASGSRSFKYGSTRRYVQKLEIVLPTGDILHLKRGEIFSDSNGIIEITTDTDKKIKAKIPTYLPPDVRKNTSGYFSGEKVDAIDLFIGSEGTLGVVTEIEFKLLTKPKGFLSGIIFFKNESNLLNFVAEARTISFQTRQIQNPTSEVQNQIDATLLEYFDEKSLSFIKEKFPETPENMAGAVFFEQETTDETEDELFMQWNELLEKHNAEIDVSWFTTTEADRQNMRDFRHALPVGVNEWIIKHKQRKVSTDIAVPDKNFASMLKFYKKSLADWGLNYIIFGHIGDNHVHVNVLPKDADEAHKAKQLYGRFIAQGIMLGGTISAEHGIGKVKSKYLYVMYGERYLNEMGELKKAFDPKGILGRNNIFEAKYVG
ncbi:MAG TPA: FAD-binding oxidoreductase [Pyrinomonadaceae bacterium]|nr:FAD-binding oxidoreductase [Pyrinomonadaceae bacterium]